MANILAHTTLPRMAKNHLLFVLTLPMTVVFLMTASLKIRAYWMMIMGFDGYGYPIAFMFFIGYAELFGSISLWLRRWALLGSMGLSVIILGAAATHIINDDPIEFSGLAYAMTPAMLLITFYHWRAARQE
ncbi:MAG: DoxX family protein [Gammaproteobacteria bacterium]|nr:DoxX family protein [Gammaproteobacteria bacterium]MYF59384.1 DoxX family protein [Gammaproteobacteria bacterium]